MVFNLLKTENFNNFLIMLNLIFSFYLCFLKCIFHIVIINLLKTVVHFFVKSKCLLFFLYIIMFLPTRLNLSPCILQIPVIYTL